MVKKSKQGFLEQLIDKVENAKRTELKIPLREEEENGRPTFEFIIDDKEFGFS